jgi:hypothetical protein
MFTRFLFNRMTLRQQVSYLKRKGVVLGTRLKDGRKIYIYMLKDLFIEVMFENDDVDNEPEKLIVLRGLDNLNNHLEKEFKTSF